MNYELAKKLKDAGFPRPQGGSDWCYEAYKGRITLENQYDDSHCGEILCDAPSLSELINACGDDLYAIYNHRKEWQAHSNSDQWDTLISHGSTPEVAVARLYLELNKKHA